ncbi:MAG TPA: F0F1 ATP synthase subunit alpha [Candidatus Gallimonas intestinavium]|uniref:ATP synthase subunit alpha n=1 Tax=Candidatus Gallimonas intestinavium TaxID=2838603 RepID=A0A9D2K0A8_9FIRM|nr:F0F1 ATP synthase subunit alpha [Candidatus Gallimonas intestinavium]
MSRTAYLYASLPPTKEQEERFLAFLEGRYGEEFTLEYRESKAYPGGFRLEVGAEVYDWSLSGRFRQLKDSLMQAIGESGDIIPLLRSRLDEWTPRAIAEEIGTVLSVGDGIAEVSGLEHAEYGEILLFSAGIRGMVLDLKRESVGCILFGDENAVSEGSAVRRTKRRAGMPVGERFLGRVVGALGDPVDGLGEILAEGYRPVEAPAPGIIDRQPVVRPLETGILAIDSMFPIGRGQRELIIGDRGTGKTAIALDAILNQRDKNVVCIYVAIGQKASSVARLVETLRLHGALDYTVVVNASAGESASLQYIAPYAGCALGEYFMERGRDVLIVYDDLSKHAVAYRALSLLLGRSPGREAYPGDVFYLHSRLLERAAHLSEARGGGSMTALPIVETQGGDVSAYIPTNIISITDGQIFLESSLFFAGQRPAVNVGLSVSRVGGDAQTQAMKRSAGTLRLDLAQYREIEVFTQFSSDLDEATRRQLEYGKGLMMLLRQKQGSPIPRHRQVFTLIAALHHVMQEIGPEEIASFTAELLTYLEHAAPEIAEGIRQEGRLSPEDKARIEALSDQFLADRRARTEAR